VVGSETGVGIGDAGLGSQRTQVGAWAHWWWMMAWMMGEWDNGGAGLKRGDCMTFSWRQVFLY
jgi:hypothetical protein